MESAVLLAERWIIAALRRQKFFSLAELNDAIAPLLERLNHRPFRKREGCRASLYTTVDRPVLQTLQVERYVMADWKTVGLRKKLRQTWAALAASKHKTRYATPPCGRETSQRRPDT